MKKKVQLRDTNTNRTRWVMVCGFCEHQGHDRLSCPGLLPENMEYRIERFGELELEDDPNAPLLNRDLDAFA